MKGKFMTVRKVVLPALVLLALTSQLSGDAHLTAEDAFSILSQPAIAIEMVVQGNEVYAAEMDFATIPTVTGASDFTDYGQLQSHWALNDINVLVSRNGIKGIPNDNGTFRFEADRAITTAELLSLILNTSGNAPTSTEWPMNVMDKANELNLIPSAWSNTATANSPIPRERMAYILYNTATNLLREDINHSDFDVDPDKVGDIAGTQYESEIKGVYDFGLIAGTGAGFNPTGNTTRAESCAIINRLFKYTNRVDNTALEYGSNSSSSSRPSYNVISIDDLNVPKEGEMFNGQTITRDPATGVLGYGNGQKGGIYLGREIGNTGSTYKVGSTSPTQLPNYDILAKGYYEQKGDYIYWSDEWAAIERIVEAKLDEKYPNVPEGTCADIYGNILEGITDRNHKDVFFMMGDEIIGGWRMVKH